MNRWLMEPEEGASSRLGRFGMILGLFALLYIAAVVVFIVVY